MITIHSNNNVSLNQTHIGTVAQERTETAFYTLTGERIGLGKRIVLSAPDKSGWSELEAALATTKPE